MATNKSNTKKLKRLYDQLGRHVDQPSLRKTEDNEVMTRKGRIEQKIKTLENTK